ncbi:MAG: hypothetical protein V4642_05060 [Bacteroidota bacterium]
MNNLRRRNPLEELKIQASILLKDLNSDEPEKFLKATARFKNLPHYAEKSAEEIGLLKSEIKRKHVLAVLAAERGFKTWSELRDDIISKECLHRPMGGSSFLNHWFAKYDEAREQLEKHGGYLLQYRDSYFVCESGYIKFLGLDSFKNEWEKIGYDWVKPADKKAWEVIFKKAKENYLLDPVSFKKKEFFKTFKARNNENK